MKQVLLVLILLIIGGIAYAAPIIGTGHHWQEWNDPEIGPLIGIRVVYYDVDNEQVLGYEAGVWLFDLTADDFQLGQPYILDSGPAFDFMAPKLADGYNDRITLLGGHGPSGPSEPGGYSGGGNIESQLFNDTVVPLYGVPPTTDADFYGYTVSSFELILNQADKDFIDVTYVVRGDPVPIPGAVWLLGSGLIALAGLRKKLKK